MLDRNNILPINDNLAFDVGKFNLQPPTSRLPRRYMHSDLRFQDDYIFFCLGGSRSSWIKPLSPTKSTCLGQLVPLDYTANVHRAPCGLRPHRTLHYSSLSRPQATAYPGVRQLPDDGKVYHGAINGKHPNQQAQRKYSVRIHRKGGNAEDMPWEVVV